jgi:hypothetical protein
MAKALPAKPAAVVPQHLATLYAPLQVVGLIGQSTVGHCGPISFRHIADIRAGVCVRPIADVFGDQEDRVIDVLRCPSAIRLFI